LYIHGLENIAIEEIREIARRKIYRYATVGYRDFIQHSDNISKEIELRGFIYNDLENSLNRLKAIIDRREVIQLFLENRPIFILPSEIEYSKRLNIIDFSIKGINFPAPGTIFVNSSEYGEVYLMDLEGKISKYLDPLQNKMNYIYPKFYDIHNGEIGAYLDNENDCIEVLDNTNLSGMSNLTVEVIVELHTLEAKTKAIVSKWVSWSDGSYFMWQYGNTVSFGVINDTGDYNSTSISGLEKNIKYHFFGVFDGNKIKIYKGKTLIGSVDLTGTVASSTLPLRIGANSSSTPTAFFGGIIYLVRIYMKALSDEEISHNVDNPNSPILDGLILWHRYLPQYEIDGKIWDLSGNHNHGIWRGKYLETQFYILNKKIEHNPSIIIDDDQTSFWNIYQAGTGNIDMSISDITYAKKYGDNSLKISIVSGSYGKVGIQHAYSSNQDWSGYDFIGFWWMGGNTGNKISLRIFTPDSSNWGEFYFYDNFEGWGKIVLPLKVPDYTYGTYDLTQVKQINFIFRESEGWGNGDVVFLDRLTLDVGQFAKFEILIPDQIFKEEQDKYYLYTLKDGGLNGFLKWRKTIDVTGNDYLPNVDVGNFYFLNRKSQYQITGSDNTAKANGLAGYDIGKVGETKDIVGTIWWNDSEAGAMTYSYRFGTYYRLGFAVKMPPYTDFDEMNKALLKLKLELKSSRITSIFR